MPIATVKLYEFLQSSNSEELEPLPLVHSTSTANLPSILNLQSIAPTPCNVFVGGDYAYFFVGRPAYRLKDIQAPAVWELPTVFVIDFDEKFPIDKCHPFDTGAFLSSPPILPSYISMFEVSDFEIPDRTSIGRYISAIFGSNERYFKRRPYSQDELKHRHDFTLEHMRIEALSRLCGERNSKQFDDRSATIEIRCKSSITISDKNVKGVVLPQEALRSGSIRRELDKLHCRVESYDEQSLSLREYYASIYERCQAIFAKEKLV